MPKQTAASSRRRANGRRASGPRAAKVPSPDVAAGSEAAPRGTAPRTDGLDPLDRERASSLADEGGTAGPAVEAELPQPATAARSGAGRLRLAASSGLAGLAALYLRRSR